MAANKKNLLIEQGSTWIDPFSLKNGYGLPYNLTGFTGRCQIRKHVTDSEILASPVLTIDHNPKSGKFVLTLTDTQTNLLTPCNAVYDIELVSPTGLVFRPYEGSVKINAGVTR